MEVTETREGGALVLALGGRLDSSNAKSFEERLLGHVQAGEGTIVLDFGTLAYISSAGLRVMLLGAKQQKAKGGKFLLCAMPAHIREVFDISGFTKILSIHKTRAEVLAAG